MQIFLFQGCTRGPHTSVKPVEPEKLTGNLSKVEDEVKVEVKVRAPVAPKLTRPSVRSPLTRLTPKSVAPALKAACSAANGAENGTGAEEVNGIKIGEACKNGGCKAVSYILRSTFYVSMSFT